MNKIKHITQTHIAVPPYCILPKKLKNNLSGRFIFTESSKYDLKSNDQYDWNKMCGIKIGLLSQEKDGTMIGWRYADNKFQIALYVHGGVKQKGFVGSGNAFVSETIIDIPINTECYFNIVINKDYAELIVQVPLPADSLRRFTTYTINIERKNGFTSGYLINSWFGGQRTANCSYLLRLNL